MERRAARRAELRRRRRLLRLRPADDLRRRVARHRQPRQRMVGDAPGSLLTASNGLRAGGEGEDVIYGGDGNDMIDESGDGQRDKLYCGEGIDAYSADKIDYVSSSCEEKMRLGPTIP